MWLEINTASSDFENVPGVIFHNCVVTISATQTTLNVRLICFDARRGSLCKPQRDQQGRYNHPQECSLHGNPPKILALRPSEISLGICFCFRFLRRAHGAFGLRPENCGASRGNTTTLFAKNLECLFQTAHIAKRKERRTKHRSDFARVGRAPPPAALRVHRPNTSPRPGGVDIRRRRSATVRQISPCVRSIGKIFTHTRNSREAAPFRPKLPKLPQAMLQNFRSLTRCKRKNEQPCANSV